MSFILQNVTRSRVSIALRPHNPTEGVPAWRVRKNARKDTLQVTIEPHTTVDLCKPPWNLTVKQAEEQTEVKEMLSREHLRLIREDKVVSQEPFTSVEKVLDLMDPTEETKESTTNEEASILDSLGDDYEGHPGVVELGSQPPESESVVPKEGPAPITDCPAGKHDFSKTTACSGCGVPEALVCKGCSFVGKNKQSIKMHQKACKAFQQR